MVFMLLASSREDLSFPVTQLELGYIALISSGAQLIQVWVTIFVSLGLPVVPPYSWAIIPSSPAMVPTKTLDGSQSFSSLMGSKLQLCLLSAVRLENASILLFSSKCLWEKLVARVGLTSLCLLSLQDLQVLVALVALNFELCLVSPRKLVRTHLASPPSPTVQMTQGECWAHLSELPSVQDLDPSSPGCLCSPLIQATYGMERLISSLLMVFEEGTMTGLNKQTDKQTELP